MRPIAQTLALSLTRNRLALRNNGRLIQTYGKAYEYEDAALKWGRRNPERATACMQPPPITTSSNLLDHQMDARFSINSWSDYWDWRKWDFSAATKEADDDSSDDALRHAQALTTHVLTAPITVAYLLFQQSEQEDTLFHDQHETPTFSLRCCCLGARSESMLPVEYWKELLLLWHCYYYRNNIQSLSTGNSRNFVRFPSVQIVLDFVGPDLVVRPPATLIYGDKATLVLRWMYKGKFHDWQYQEDPNKDTSSKADYSYRMDYDAFIFLNPGIGHPHLRADWKPTLSLLLSPIENSVKRPRCLLWTAHSKLDADRDKDQLRAYTGAPSSAQLPFDDNSYLENPFSSRITYQDPFDATHLVRPNHYCYHTIIKSETALKP